MNVVSYFDGISCGMLALERANIPVENYFAYEIDKYAMEISNKNLPQVKQMGNVVGSDLSILPKIDLLIGGSPCQGFSFAGKQLNFNDPRSALFFEFVRALMYLKAKNPDIKFLLENVKMKKEYQDVISGYLGVEPVLIDSSNFSAQNRARLYWTNIEGPKEMKRTTEGLKLKDIIETGVVDRDKSYCIDANYWKGTTIEQYIKKARRQVVFEATAFTERRTEEAKRIRQEYKQKYGRDFCPRREKEMVPRTDGKMNCITATYSLKEHTILDEKINYRKLTPLECERLQTLPDNHTSGVSDTQRYKMVGNAWTVDVVSYIFSFLKGSV